jgi:hypothetical protein
LRAFVPPLRETMVASLCAVAPLPGISLQAFFPPLRETMIASLCAVVPPMREDLFAF